MNYVNSIKSPATRKIYIALLRHITYVIRINPLDKIEIIQIDRFKDEQGKTLKRYQFKVTHVNNGKDQLWDTSKTVCSQIIAELKKGFTVLKVTRTGADRSTTYTIEGVQ